MENMGYITPEMEIIGFEAEDVITTSGNRKDEFEEIPV